MANLTKIELDDGSFIMIEAPETNIPAPSNAEKGRTTRGGDSGQSHVIRQFTEMQDTIKRFSGYTIDSFKDVSNANVDKVTLEFGINVGGEARIPYITKGTVSSNLKIKVECTFPEK